VSPYVKRCIESFTSDWVVIHRKYKGRISPIARDRLLQDTPRQDFEVCSVENNISLFELIDFFFDKNSIFRNENNFFKLRLIKRIQMAADHQTRKMICLIVEIHREDLGQVWIYGIRSMIHYCQVY